MKRFFLTILFLFVFALSASAKTQTVKVMALSDFSTQNPSPTFRAEIIEGEIFKGDFLDSGTIVEGRVIRIESPKFGKQNAYFVFLPYVLTQNGKTTTTKEPMAVAKVVGYSPVDTKKLVGKVFKTAANFVVKGASLGISFVEGAAKAQEGDRFQSGLVNVYNDSPLSYIEPGKELNIEPGDILILKLSEFSTY
ncbi:MAG TPA: hypothetical protein PKI94_08140 [Candidatus Gastranaerophilaceae bacterium]|nr:hypothetical protein [Candidatus Gastranaerophilaceae bacterium]